MMNISLKITEDTGHVEKREECLRFLRSAVVDVGLTSKASARSKFLMAIHSRGSPIMHIPPRPVVGPALHRADIREEMAGHLLEACEAAADGDLAGTAAGMEAAGQAGADGIRKVIDEGVPPPNSPVTLSGGWIYNRVARKGVRVEGKNGDTPLKDTGQLYNDFDWEIREG